MTASLLAFAAPGGAQDVHLGVASCSSAPCHGAGGALGKGIRQDEYGTWLRHDAHAQSYQTLRNERSQRIARNLGLGAAHEAGVCLDCHADFVPAERRGERFHIEDGVGCEACHGGAERWIDVHDEGRSPERDFSDLGLRRLDRPEVRAAVCLSCHFGSGEKFISHRIMGAGHPRLSFELDTFTQIMPPHHVADDDWAARGKVPQEPVRVWAVGQAVAVREILTALADPQLRRDGIWPEFVFFDCHACHHPMEPPRWKRRESAGQAGRPGTARMNDAHLLMLKLVLAAVDAGDAQRLHERTLDLHAALSRGTRPLDAAIARLRELVEAALPKLQAWQPRAGEVRDLGRAVVAQGLAGDHRDYAAAEQATMALHAVAATLNQLEAIEAARVPAVQADLDALLEATEDEDAYRPAAFVAALSHLGKELAAVE